MASSFPATENSEEPKDYGLAAMWDRDVVPRSGPWKFERPAEGWHLGALLQDTLARNASQSCRTVFLLGDPTLTAYRVEPPTGLGAAVGAVCVAGSKTVTLTWTAPVEAVDGYYIYRGTSVAEALKTTPLNGTQPWVPPGALSYPFCTPTGASVFVVRAAKLITSGGAGTFYHLSPGVSASVNVN